LCFLILGSLGKGLFEKSPFPKPHLQKLSYESDRQSPVQIRNTKTAVQPTETQSSNALHTLCPHTSLKFFERGLGKTFFQKSFPRKNLTLL
ncbi:MAG: hypothetical protein IJV76_06855, partial [Clostridia bacterium]|nr:hypothetical protein [Clostridia bacterium]